jgi:ATP-dependent exoDNAse (exonuclease V) beta subunit
LRHGDQVVAADILDYKTDHVPTDADIASKVETYAPQIQAYRRAVAKLTGLPPAAIAARLLFTGPGTLRSIPWN